MRIISNMVKNEGLSSFFKGLTPKLLMTGPKLVFSFWIGMFYISLCVGRMLTYACSPNFDPYVRQDGRLIDLRYHSDSAARHVIDFLVPPHVLACYGVGFVLGLYDRWHS